MAANISHGPHQGLAAFHSPSHPSEPGWMRSRSNHSNEDVSSSLGCSNETYGSENGTDKSARRPSSSLSSPASSAVSRSGSISSARLGPDIPASSFHDSRISFNSSNSNLTSDTASARDSVFSSSTSISTVASSIPSVPSPKTALAKFDSSLKNSEHATDTELAFPGLSQKSDAPITPATLANDATCRKLDRARSFPSSFGTHSEKSQDAIVLSTLGGRGQQGSSYSFPLDPSTLNGQKNSSKAQTGASEFEEFNQQAGLYPQELVQSTSSKEHKDHHAPRPANHTRAGSSPVSMSSLSQSATSLSSKDSHENDLALTQSRHSAWSQLDRQAWVSPADPLSQEGAELHSRSLSCPGRPMGDSASDSIPMVPGQKQLSFQGSEAGRTIDMASGPTSSNQTLCGADFVPSDEAMLDIESTSSAEEPMDEPMDAATVLQMACTYPPLPGLWETCAAWSDDLQPGSESYSRNLGGMGVPLSSSGGQLDVNFPVADTGADPYRASSGYSRGRSSGFYSDMNSGSLPLSSAQDAALWYGAGVREAHYSLRLSSLPAQELGHDYVRQLVLENPFFVPPNQQRLFPLWSECAAVGPWADGQCSSHCEAQAEPDTRMSTSTSHANGRPHHVAHQWNPAIRCLEPMWTEWQWGNTAP